MPTNSATTLRLLAVASFVVMPRAAVAQAVSAACKPVIDANAKEISTPHHLYQTEASPQKGAKPRTSEVIATATASYVLVDGKWARVNMTPKENLAQMQENLRNAKVYQCKQLPDAQINAVSALVYSAHSENEMAKSDAQVWVAKSTGLIVREDIDMYTDDPSDGKRHISERFDYTNVQPPPGVK